MEQHLKEVLQALWPEPLAETDRTPLEIYTALGVASETVAETWLLGFLRSKEALVKVFGDKYTRIVAAGRLKEWEFQDRKFTGSTGREILIYIERHIR